jgi:hypothetical protein
MNEFYRTLQPSCWGGDRAHAAVRGPHVCCRSCWRQGWEGRTLRHSVEAAGATGPMWLGHRSALAARD